MIINRQVDIDKIKKYIYTLTQKTSHSCHFVPIKYYNMTFGAKMVPN